MEKVVPYDASEERAMSTRTTVKTTTYVQCDLCGSSWSVDGEVELRDKVRVDLPFLPSDVRGVDVVYEGLLEAKLLDLCTTCREDVKTAFDLCASRRSEDKGTYR